MDSRVAADPSALMHLYVAGERGGVGHADIVLHDTIMSDVSVSHHHIAVAEPSSPVAAGGSAGDARECADYVVIANPDMLRASPGVLVLGRTAYVAVSLEDVADPDDRLALYDRV
jgi:hypothetical protein